MNTVPTAPQGGLMRYFSLALIVALFCMSATPAFAGRRYNSSTGYTQDVYGSWEKNSNAYKDSDGDGVVNHYDRNNKNSSIW